MTTKIIYLTPIQTIFNYVKKLSCNYLTATPCESLNYKKREIRRDKILIKAGEEYCKSSNQILSPTLLAPLSSPAKQTKAKAIMEMIGLGS